MTSTLAPPPAELVPASPAGRRTSNRAITRWAWRMLRREWRQQLLVLILLTVAVAATTVGLGLVVNVQSSNQGVLGTANTRIEVAEPGRQVGADIAAARRAFGTVEAIEHESVPVPGSITPVDLRAQDPHGHFGTPMLRLVSGRYPEGAGQVAVTSQVASIFTLGVGDDMAVDGQSLRVVGVVENPKDLADSFALVAPGHLPGTASRLTLLTDASAASAEQFRPPSGNARGIMSNGTTAAQQRRVQALAVLLLATIGLTFIGLLAVAGFTVVAHRRLRALGMIGAIGATDRQVRRVMIANGAVVGAIGATVGTLAGLVAWFALRPAFERLVGHRIDLASMPWWAVIAAAALAILAALAASWWPARSAARMPIVAALSGRPAPPQPAHRFAVLGVALAAGGFTLLVLAHRANTVLIVTGIPVTTAGMLLLAPLGIRALAMTAGRAPVAVRLAVRDLVRYQARSGAALAAAGLAVGIAATIAITAAAQQAADHTLSGGNLPTNQLIVWLSGNPGSPGGGPKAFAAPTNGDGDAQPGPSAAAVSNARSVADAIARSLNARHVVELDIAVDTHSAVPAGMPSDARNLTITRPIREHGQSGWTFVGIPYVANAAILHLYGLPAHAIDPSAGVVTARTDLSGAQLGTGFRGDFRPVTIQVDKRLPNYTSAPNTLVTERTLRTLGVAPQPAGWIVQSARPLTAAQIADARHRAAAAGITIETRTSGDHSLQRLREYATLAGLLLALGVLAMTVGLIRSETAGDLRILTATGASARTRRSLTAATAVALALLAGLLGTAGAYLALIAWHWHHVDYLSHPPYAELIALVVGLPVAALVGGWLLGRAPTAIAHSPME